MCVECVLGYFLWGFVFGFVFFCVENVVERILLLGWIFFVYMRGWELCVVLLVCWLGVICVFVWGRKRIEIVMRGKCRGVINY